MTNYRQFNGKSFSTKVGDLPMYVEKFSLDVNNDRAVAMKNGLPDGWLQGNLTGSGTITLDLVEFSKLAAAAKQAGSYEDLEPFDINSHAAIGDIEFKVEAFGCKLAIEKVLDHDDSSSDKSTIDIAFDIVSPDFVSINGVPMRKRPAA